MYYLHSNLSYPTTEIIKQTQKIATFLTEFISDSRLYTYVHIYRKDADSYVYLNTKKIFA